MLPRLSRNAAEKTWTCPTCGVIPPIALADGWFARRLCRCERAAFEAEQVHQLQEEQRQTRTALTYTWLGRAWSEPGLAAKTFATFRGERQPDAYELAQAFAAATVGTLALYGSYGTGKCVAASEIITLSNGKRIAARELIGQEFEILTLIDGRPTPVKAQAEFNALETVYQIETRSGRHVIRNGDHPFWTARIERPYLGASTKRSMHIQEWTPLRNIQVDDLIAVTTCLPAFPDTPGPLSDTEIRILAYLIGDGGYSRPSIRFSQQNNVQLDEFRACIVELGCSLVHHSHYDWRIVGIGRGPHCNAVINLLKRNGMMGTLSREKRFPSLIWSLHERQLALFLSRLFATDGWATVRAPSKKRMQQAHIGFCSASRGLVEDIQEALVRLGIYSSISFKKGTNAWALDISHASDLLRFADIIGIYGKEEAIEHVVMIAKERMNLPNKHYWRTLNAVSGTHWERVKSITPLGIHATIAIEVSGPKTFLTLFYEHNTHLLAAIANAVADARRTCRFASVVSLFDALQERIQAGQDYHELVRKAIQAPLLILDDLDKLKPSEFREETLYKILNGRHVAGLPLAFSANRAPDELVRWIGEASRSRLMAGLIPVHMNGSDYRLEEKT